MTRPIEGPEPVKVLRGRSTFLRPAERGDIPRFVDWMNDERTLVYLAARAPIGLAEEERWFERMVERQGDDHWLFVICRLGDESPIGTIGLFDIDLRNGGAGLGISLGDPADRGQGLGTDALEAMLDFGFGELRLERIWLDVYDFNRRAFRSYEKAGFADEGTLRHAIYRRGRFQDLHRMAILRDEWAQRRSADPFPGPPTEGGG
jgi:RimJ/RimL family protein N-acetyltransferase